VWPGLEFRQAPMVLFGQFHCLETKTDDSFLL